jgi:large subunit ribosomal protein L1
MADKNKLLGALKKALEDKGKRKFKQSVELMINMRGINFSKTENRLNLDIPLPAGKGEKMPKIAVIANESVANDARKAGAELTILPDQIDSYAQQKEKLKDLAKNYTLLAEPKLMGQIAKSLGTYLGPKGKLPKPIMGDISKIIDATRRSVRIVSKGKYLPVAHAFIGTETMNEADLLENAEAVYDAVKGKVNEPNIKSVYVKLSMGKPIKV